MAKEYLPLLAINGQRFQSGVPTRSLIDRPYKARGLLLKGVVTATYVVDDPNHFQNDTHTPEGAKGVYCDVMAYANNVPGMRWRFIPRCMVLQDRGGIHDGKIWKPRAATLDTSSGTVDETDNVVDLDKGTNPANLDGDHVLIGFVNDNLNEPIILGGVHHPNVDVGNEESTQRQRLQLKQVDGDPNFWKHHGSKFGVDTNGDFVVDTRFAHDGEYENDGHEKDPPTDGSGSQQFDLPLDAEQKVTFWDMSNQESPVAKVTLETNQDKYTLTFVDSGFTFEVDDSGSQIKLGGSAEKAVLDSLVQGELSRLQTELNNLKWLIGRIRFPICEFPVPLLFGDIIECFKAPLAYIAKTQPPINLRTGAEATPNNALMDTDAGGGEFFGSPTGPTALDVLPESANPGPTNSDTVVIKS